MVVGKLDKETMPSIPPWEHKMLEGKGRFINRLTKTAGKLYDRFFIYVPTQIARDSSFPFKPGEPVQIRIDVENRRLIVEKWKPEQG